MFHLFRWFFAPFPNTKKLYTCFKSREQFIDPRVPTQFDKIGTEQQQQHASKVIFQYRFHKGIKEFADKGREATKQELYKNLLGMDAVGMVKPHNLDKKRCINALTYLMFLKQKRTGKMKARELSLQYDMKEVKKKVMAHLLLNQMKKSFSMFCALITTFIWGTAFIAQDTGMDNIGPLTFNSSRFFVGFLTILPFAILIEKKKIRTEIKKNSKLFFKYLIFMGVSLFLGTFLQQAALQYTNIANAAFFTVFYVPFVPIILFIIYKEKVHWSIWPSIALCIVGVYLLTDFSNAEIMLGDTLVIFCSIFWALHIIFAGKFMRDFDIPIFYAALQAAFVFSLSII